jgi:DNA-binding MarR family transcriptional regulator
VKKPARARADALLDPAHCVSNNLHQTARAISRIYAQEMQQADLRRAQFSLLNHLERLGAISLSELAEHMYMERTTLTRNLRPLEDAGYVARRACDDARVKRVELTAADHRKLSQARRHWRRAQQRVLAAFGAERWQALEVSLRALRKIEL